MSIEKLKMQPWDVAPLVTKIQFKGRKCSDGQCCSYKGFDCPHSQSASGQARGGRGHKNRGAQIYVIELKVANEDIGKIIGKQGHAARAIRTILNAASTKIKKRSTLEIFE